MSETIEQLTKQYNPNTLLTFFNDFANFNPDNTDLDHELDDGAVLGAFELDDGTEVPVVAVPVNDARRKRKSAFQGVVNFLKQTTRNAALAVFHDDTGAYRIALIYATEFRGTRLPKFTSYRRASLLVEPGRYNKTFRQQMQKLAEYADALTWDDLKTVFSLEAVNRQFYKEFAQVFEDDLVPGVTGYPQAQKAHDFALAFVARTLFLGFVAKKGWLGDDEHFLPSLWREYRRTGQTDRFYSDWLEPLFFEALKAPPGNRLDGVDHLPENVRSWLLEAPYLNGELFNRKRGVDDQGAYIKDEAIGKFFDFLFEYNFTVEENTASDADLELSPEFLGLILEKLVNTVGVEGKATELGAHYTPRTEVDLMARLALAEYLARQGIPLEAAYNLMRGDTESLGQDQMQRAKSLLKEAKILDPAVGSGAFLMGVLQVLEETLEQLGETRTVSLKRSLMQNLYGVDVLSWAVWMAELRLWLSYFVELDDSNRYSKEPLLPSLGLKIRQGDSVLQTVGTTPLPIRLAPDEKTLRKEEVKKAYDELIRIKDDYFNNRGVKLQAVEEKERRFLAKFVEALLIGTGKRNELFPETPSPTTQELDQEIERIHNLLAQEKRPFAYFLDFAEVLLGPKGGFDIVIGNPPYLRQEEIRDLLGRFDKPSDYKLVLRKTAAEDIEQFGPYTQISQLPVPDGRSDLYTYFYVRSLLLLSNKGVHAFVVSNSWLDVQYGAWLQQVFLDAAPLRYVIESRVRRSFEALVNTVITVAHALRKQKVPKSWPVLFIAVRRPFEEVDLLQEALRASERVGFNSKEALS